ncbi:MAG TPA: hypothetical protein VFG59_00320 [Anaeromyxobacter sp.]|nr:hypothetical protein [Anaeromyxobacter sp.]
MSLLALKLLLPPALVGLASLAGQRWGHRMGGLFAALPIVAGPALLLYALEEGPAFAAAAARSSLLGLCPLAGFCVVDAAVARWTGGLLREVSASLSLAAGWVAFLALAFLLMPLEVPAWACVPAGAAALVAGLSLLPGVPGDGRPPARHHPGLELALRMLAAAALVTGLTGLAGRLGPTFSGLLTPFPVASSVVVAGAHLADGPGALPETLRGFLSGLFGFVVFLAALAAGLERLGLAASFSLGIMGSAGAAAVVAWRPWGRTR